MNILLFITSMLILFSIMTFGKLNQFQNSALINHTFESYIKNEKAKTDDKAAEDRYEEITVSTKGEIEINKSIVRKHLTFKLFVNKEERESHLQEREEFAYLIKNLMQILFHDKQFYLEFAEKRPGFLDELLSAIEEESAKLTWKISRKKDLANLRLQDPALDTLFSKMLNQSLLDFITLDKSNYQVRVWLAPEEVLKTFYPMEIVNEIARERLVLHTLIMKGNLSKEEAANQLKQNFASYKDPHLSLNRLDYSTSKTRPPKPSNLEILQ
ncbi:MAG: hypothetical protein WD595_04870 [Waddliaceae bacterium]